MAIRKHPLVLVLVRLCLTPLFSRLLEFAPDRARQPRLLSGILAGILLSEAASDQIPAFTANIFSLDSIPYLSLIANLGLVASLFLISTLIHFSLIRRDSASAISVGLRHKCVNPSVKVTTRMTFFGTPTDITASSDLSRVLSELRLFIDPVRLVVLASGVLSDVIGGCLPALSVALASAGSGVVVVYILLAMLGWTLPLHFLGQTGAELTRAKDRVVDGAGRPDAWLSLRGPRARPHLGVLLAR